MRAGRLDRRIDIQRKTVTQSASGQPIATWSSLAVGRWASATPVRGDERFRQPQIAAEQAMEFQIRYSASVADLSPLDRIIYPSGSTAATAIYDIAAVDEIGRREGLKITAVRRPDVSGV